MKYLQSVALILLLIMGFGLWVRGQQQPTSSAPAQPAIQPARIAVIDSRAFSAENGIQQLLQQVKQVNDRFRPRYDELQKLQAEVQALEDDIRTKSANWTLDVRQQRQEQLDRKKTDGQRLSEDLQREYQREMQKVTGPISERVETLLDQYAAKRGITMILDLAPLNQAGAVPYFDQAIDVTRDFINEYNRANPAGQ
jgi:Skp family chaperone for outer membrane proteins